MSDLDLNTKNLKDQVADTGAEMKQRAGDALKASADVARDKLRDAADAAKDAASGTADHLNEQARQQQRTGADFIERFAGNIREAGRAFESDAPFAARGINSAAEYVQDAAEKVRNGSFRDLVDGATDFAKRQPAAFLGISVLAGFAAVRFLKASGGQSSSSSSSSPPIGAPEKSSSVDGNSWAEKSTSPRGNMS